MMIEQAGPERSVEMKERKRLLAAVGVLVFSVGVLLGLAFYGAAAWGDLEAFLFAASVDADGSLGSLRCPIMITSTESGTLSATFQNPSERVIRPTIRTHISEGFVTLMRRIDDQPSLEPGEKKRLEWEVTADDATYGYLVLARVFVKYPYPLPSRTSACGVLVIDLPGWTGGQVTALVVVSSLLCLVAGVGLWVAGNRPLGGRIQDASRAMIVLAVVVLLGIATSFAEWWLLSGLLLVIALLLIGAIISYFVRSR
jgi:hypothetical protein